jgi:hypothetical protein
MPDYNPLADEEAYGLTASAAITGGNLVEITGNGTVGPAGETSQKVVGVAAYDSISGVLVTVLDLDDYHVSTISGVGAIAAGNPIKAGAAGTVEAYVVGTDAVTALLGSCIIGGAANGSCTWKGR